MPGKRVQLDDETWQALDLLARDQMKTFQELADEAFTDLLRKNRSPGRFEGRTTQALARARRSMSSGDEKEGARKALTRPRMIEWIRPVRNGAAPFSV
jgi:hypothetical protein